jgi:hypothetical protein
VKNVIRAAPILVALALFLSVLGIVQLTQSGTALAAEGTLKIRASTSTTSTLLSFAAYNRSVGVIVVDSDLNGAGTLTVSVKSTTDPTTGITLTLNESPTGTFSALLKIATTTSTSTAPAVIKTIDGDTVTINYTDASLGVTTPATLTVETGKPTISSLTPGNATITNIASHTLSVDVTDAQSSIDLSTIKFLFSTAVSIGTSTVPITEISPSSTTVIDDGYTATRSFTFSEGVTWIGVKVSDGAGNESIYDADTSTSSVNDGNTVTYDATAPTISTVTTGNYWDSVTKTVLKNRRTSLEIEFTDALLNLDPASILPTDFAVAGTTVTAADIFSASNEKPKSVFLTVEDDIAPNAKPVVTIVGDGVSDQAGNTLANVNKTAVDGIAPLLTVTLSKALASKDDQVEITVVSDEDLAAAPVVIVLTAESSVAASTAVTATSTQTITAVPSITSRTWVATTAKTNKTGLMNVSVSATDKAAAANTATMGVVGNTDADTASAITYESDINLPSPTITPATGTSPVTRDPYFITIDFALEGTENNDDSYATVTITSFTYDGTDMLSSVTSEDNIKFLVAISGITTASHTVTVNAIDAAGNVLAADASSTFTIAERASIKIPIQPGWNLVSLPGSPSDTALNTVLANNAEISAVVSYDAALPGGFLSAVRDVDGNFAGTLTTIDASRGYWMLSSVFKNLEVDVSPLAAGHAGVLPPSIPVSKGWNLVPVVDISGTIAAGSAKDTATDYFASLGATVTRIYTFDTVLNQWQLKIGTDNVLVGKAYWIFATAAGTLAP